VTVPAVLAWTAKDVQVEEWKYRYFMLAPLPKDRVFELTQKLAYKLWEEKGRPIWDDQRDWYEAESMTASGACRFVDQ